MMKLKKINDGYSLLTVIFILTFILTVSILAVLFISFYLHLSSMNLKKSSGWEPFYKTLTTLKEKYFEITLRDNYTSPNEGWFKEIPDSIDGYKITVVAEDSKIDLNQIETALFFKNDNKNSINSSTAFNIDFSKADKKYFYYFSDIESLKKDLIKSEKEQVKDSTDDLNKYFTIFNVPNLNIIDQNKLKIFLSSLNFNASTGSSIENAVKSARGSAAKSYLNYRGSNMVQSGLLLNKSVYENLKNLTWPENINLFMLFDYKGQINLNFVNEKVFELSVKACGPQDADYKEFWNKIKAKQDGLQTIKETDLDAIFGYSYVGSGTNTERIKNWLYYEKIFSVDSNLFKITIQKDNKLLTAYFRRYIDREVKVKILKLNVEILKVNKK